jgi:hypothetical protein
MRWWCSAARGLALAIVCARVLDAQVARGTVRERASGDSLPGVLVELQREGAGDGAKPVAATLSGPDGAFALRAPSPGTYQLVAKRIGVRRFRSDAFLLGAGETRSVDVTVDAVRFVLPQVVVTATSACSGDAAEATRLAALWDEAQTALLATQISLRERRYRARVTRYVRELDPRSRRVLSETRSEATGVVARPFAAVAPESLSARGYWAIERDSGVVFHGPDADALLSEVFLDDHCFAEAATRRDRAGLVGLAFSPAAGRTTPDVTGTLWLDAATHELRLVEFTYTPMPGGVDAGAGGELHFARLASGAWMVRRWWLRVPVYARAASPVATEETSSPWVLVRPVALRLREEGGEVTAETPRTPAIPNYDLLTPR